MTAAPPSRVPLWVLALGTTLGMQTVASFLDQSPPIIAPLLTAGVGLAPERVGNLSSLNSLGTVAVPPVRRAAAVQVMVLARRARAAR